MPSSCRPGEGLHACCAAQRQHQPFAEEATMARRKKGPGEIAHDPENRDPITQTPGAHPIGVGAGAAGAGAAGAAIGGAMGGPLGAVVGAAVGAVAGGLGGKGAAEAVNPTVQDTSGRQTYIGRAYVRPNEPYET